MAKFDKAALNHIQIEAHESSVKRAAYFADLQVFAAKKVLMENDIEVSDANIIALAQVIATNCAAASD